MSKMTIDLTGSVAYGGNTRVTYDDIILSYSNVQAKIEPYIYFEKLTDYGTSHVFNIEDDAIATDFNMKTPSANIRYASIESPECRIIDRDITRSWSKKVYATSGRRPDTSILQKIAEALTRDTIQSVINELVAVYAGGNSAEMAVIPATGDSTDKGAYRGLNRGQLMDAKVYLDYSDMSYDNRVVIGSSLVFSKMISNDKEFRNSNYIGSTYNIAKGIMPDMYSGFNFFSVPQLTKFIDSNGVEVTIGIPTSSKVGSAITGAGGTGNRETHVVFAISKNALGYVMRDNEALAMEESVKDYNILFRKTYGHGSKIIKNSGVVAIECEFEKDTGVPKTVHGGKKTILKG